MLSLDASKITKNIVLLLHEIGMNCIYNPDYFHKIHSVTSVQYEQMWQRAVCCHKYSNNRDFATVLRGQFYFSLFDSFCDQNGLVAGAKFVFYENALDSTKTNHSCSLGMLLSREVIEKFTCHQCQLKIYRSLVGFLVVNVMNIARDCWINKQKQND